MKTKIKFLILFFLIFNISSWGLFSQDAVLNPEFLLKQFPNSVKTTKGEVIYLYGQIQTTKGKILRDVRVEIWQTDTEGYYDHPNSSGNEKRDKNFQFFGTAEVDKNGWYIFRTIIPGKYFPRPRHIHFKVKRGEETLLTSQFYFDDNIVAAKDLFDLSIYHKKRDDNDLPLVSYLGKVHSRGDIFIGRGGRFKATEDDAEGPYYPVVDVLRYDNDLAN